MHNASAQEQPAQVQRGAAVLHILCGLYIKRCVANCVQRGRNEATRHKMKLLGRRNSTCRNALKHASLTIQK
eukprot:scaffold191017_cov19-Tisochrysis_lutea.AAC.1